MNPDVRLGFSFTSLKEFNLTHPVNINISSSKPGRTWNSILYNASFSKWSSSLSQFILMWVLVCRWFVQEFREFMSSARKLAGWMIIANKEVLHFGSWAFKSGWPLETFQSLYLLLSRTSITFQSFYFFPTTHGYNKDILAIFGTWDEKWKWIFCFHWHFVSIGMDLVIPILVSWCT